MQAFFNPLDSLCKSVRGGIAEKTKLKFFVKADGNACFLRVRKDGEDLVLYPMEREFVSYKTDIRSSEEAILTPENIESAVYRAKNGDFGFKAEVEFSSSGLYFYSFEIDGEIYGCDRNNPYGENFGRLIRGGAEFSQTVYKEGSGTPRDFEGGVIYQIFPDRFFRFGDTSPRKEQRLREKWGELPDYLPVDGKVLNDDFFGGNLKGITEKLDYIKSLGTTVIYLNPVFKAYSNHRYDTGDYMLADELLGSEDDLKELFENAEKRGIKVVLDGVFNHTGDDSRYFNKKGRYDSIGAYQSKSSEYYTWYDFIEYPEKYESWWGIETLPRINKASEDFKEFVCGENGVLKKYLRDGACGWRLDVVDELPGEFVKRIRKSVKELSKNAIIIGEVWENVTDKISYGVRREYFHGEEIDSAMNYPLKSAIIDCFCSDDVTGLSSVLLKQTDSYPKRNLDLLMNILGTHDTARIINCLSGRSCPAGRILQAHDELNEEERLRGAERVMLASAVLYTVYGIPSLYYGDEIGTTGWADPFNRKCFDWSKTESGGENMQISDENMQLSREENGSAGGEKDISLKLLGFFRKLGRMRACHEAFLSGELSVLFRTKRSLIYKRESENEVCYVALNLGGQSYNLNFSSAVTEELKGETSNSHTVSYGQIKIFFEKK